MWTQFLIGGVFLFLGVAIHIFKWYFLISGYNTMSKEKKAKYNVEGIATLMRNVFFGMALIIIIGYFISNSLKKKKPRSIRMVLGKSWGPTVISMAVFLF